MSILVFILHVLGSCEQGISVRNCACSKVSIPQTVIVVINSHSSSWPGHWSNIQGREKVRGSCKSMSLRIFLGVAV